MLKKSIFISTICALTLTSTLNAKEYSLEELIAIAVKNNTNIEVSKNQKDIKKEELNLAKTSYLPKVTTSADIGRYDIKTAGGSQDGNANSVSISANQLIYDFGKTKSSIEASKHNLEASSSDITLSKQSTILSVKQAYYDILNKYQQLIVANEAVKLDELQLSQAKEYFKAGVRTQIDVTNAQLNLSNSQLKKVQSEYDLKTSKTKLISILGTKIPSDIKVQGRSLDVKELSRKASLKYKSADELVDLGLEKRSELKKYQALIKTNKSNLKNVQSQYYPRIDVSASYTDQNSDDISSLDTDQAALIFGLKWDLYTGNSTKSEKKIALSNLKTTYKQFEQQKLDITQEITSSYFDAKQSFESIKIGVLSLDLATKNLDLAMQRYKAGLNDLLEVNDAKLEYTQSKSSLVNTYYTYLINVADLEYSVGIINDK